MMRIACDGIDYIIVRRREKTPSNCIEHDLISYCLLAKERVDLQ